MRKFTFKHGVHPPESKKTEKERIVKAPVPDEVVIPFSQHTGAPAKPIVKVGEEVKLGTKIGEAQGFISANIHSSVSGVVKKIEEKPHPVGGYSLSCVIENNGKEELDNSIKERDYQSLEPEELINIIKDMGIVGLGGAAFPTNVKLSPPKGKSFDTVVLNGAECEPYLTCDHRLMLEKPANILKGGKIIKKILGAKRGIIAVEENKPDAISVMEKLVGKYGFELCVLKTKYPQGAEKQLIKALTGREIPSGGLPMDVGVYVQNVGTSLAIYEALRFGKPLFERIITVTGDVKSPKNLRVRIGTSFKELIDFCEGYSGEPKKLIMGGPMMGIAQYTDTVPVVKGTSGIYVQNLKNLNIVPESPCIRCGRCVDACPMGLVPCQIADFIDKKKFDEAKFLGVLDCIECGGCSYVCPAGRNLVHKFKYAKLMLRKKR
jgi:electron transport complex protein RnfC